MTRSGRIVLLSCLALAAACAAPPGPGGPSDGIIVPDGKADDFLSLSAKEFVVSGRDTVTIEEDLVSASEDERMARVHELVGYQQIAIAWFLTQYLIDKEHDAGNASYGGYGAMARNSTYEQLDIRQEDERTYSFFFEQLVAGKSDLMNRLPLMNAEDGTRQFTLTMGRPTNEELARLETNHEWYRDSPWDDFNPETLDESRKRDLPVAIRPEVESDDAWLDYQAMLADGTLDIDVHFGWDYHSDYHIKHARALFDWLSGRGFQAPVESFDDLTRESGPFTRTFSAGGRDIAVEVRIFYGKTGTDTDPDTAEGGRVLENDMRGSLATRDVIMYSGHSGPFYGFALANWRRTDEGDLDDSEMSSVEMPESRSQLVVAEGCDTYQIGEAFRANPAKPDGRFIDIITTTAPSNASTPAAVQDIITRLLEEDSDGRHNPQPIRALLRDLDSNSSWFHTMYGVHGIDDNPQLHPYGDLAMACQECSTDADCGGPGNRCVGIGSSGKRCAPSCTTDAGCGEGMACRDIASSSTMTIYDTVCVPQDLSCG